jgi:hypothetical protein
VKLLFDENLSPQLVDSLSDLYPDSAHVHQCGLGSADDAAIWEHANPRQCPNSIREWSSSWSVVSMKPSELVSASRSQSSKLLQVLPRISEEVVLELALQEQ